MRSAGGPGAPTAEPARSSRTRRSLAGCLIVATLSFAGAGFAAGARWSIEPTVVPAGARAGVLSAVACPSPAHCTAVGYVTDRAGAGVALSEQWSGHRWSVAPTPALPGTRAALFFGVSCPATTACTAVGSAVGRSGRTRPLAEHWDGRRWAVQPTPAGAGAAGYLAGVSCASVRACVAVGYTGERSGSTGVALAERWDGHRWHIERTAGWTGARASFLSGVSCPRPRACTAVGFADGADGAATPIAEHYEGRRWRLQSMNRAPGQIDVQLAGVACAGARSCTAVGFFTNVTGIDVMLAEHWNGIRWAQQKPPYPRGARYAQFSGVSCPSSRSCIAVGLFNDVEGTDAILVERSRGRRWTMQRTPRPAATISRSLSGVACWSANACTAVGSSSNLAGAAIPLAAGAS